MPVWDENTFEGYQPSQLAFVAQLPGGGGQKEWENGMLSWLGAGERLSLEADTASFLESCHKAVSPLRAGTSALLIPSPYNSVGLGSNEEGRRGGEGGTEKGLLRKTEGLQIYRHCWAPGKRLSEGK